MVLAINHRDPPRGQATGFLWQVIALQENSVSIAARVSAWMGNTLESSFQIQAKDKVSYITVNLPLLRLTPKTIKETFLQCLLV